MANTFSHIQLHIVFAVKYRDAMLADSWRKDLFAYIGGIIKGSGNFGFIVGGYRDHIHILVGCRPSVNIPDLVKEIKVVSHKWIQARHKCRFAWQEGYGVFSISKSHEEALKQYIANQAVHHSNVTFTEEYRRLLKVNVVDFDERFIFQEPI